MKMLRETLRRFMHRYSNVILKKLKRTQTYNDIGKWDKLIQEYTILQDIYNAIENSDAASRLVTPTSYMNELNAVKEQAAEDYYQLG